MSDDNRFHDSHGLIAEMFFEAPPYLRPGNMFVPEVALVEYCCPRASLLDMHVGDAIG